MECENSDENLHFAEAVVTFISLAFTLAIFTIQTYHKLKTFLHAPVEIQEYLSTLRQGLYEERQHMKRVRRRRLPQAYDENAENAPMDLARLPEGGGMPVVYSHAQGGRRNLERHPTARDEDNGKPRIYRQAGSPMRVIRDAFKVLIREFKVAEKPFLKLVSASDKEEDLEWSYDISGTREYYRTSFRHRFWWLTYKNDVVGISDRLVRLQLRRISVETTESHLTLADNEIMMRTYGDYLKHCEHMLVELSRAYGR